MNVGISKGSVSAPILFLLDFGDLLSTVSNSIHSLINEFILYRPVSYMNSGHVNAYIKYDRCVGHTSLNSKRNTSSPGVAKTKLHLVLPKQLVSISLKFLSFTSHLSFHFFKLRSTDFVPLLDLSNSASLC